MAECGKKDTCKNYNKKCSECWTNSSLYNTHPCYTSKDLEEVVRCKDCKFWGIPHANDIEKSHYCCRDNMWCMPLRFADDYCSYGERRERNDRPRKENL